MEYFLYDSTQKDNCQFIKYACNVTERRRAVTKQSALCTHWLSALADKIKNAAENSAADFIAGTSDSALNLVGAEASGTCVNMAGSSVNDSLDALDVGLPCTIGTSVGMGNLDTKGHALATKITLSHFIAPPII